MAGGMRLALALILVATLAQQQLGAQGQFAQAEAQVVGAIQRAAAAPEGQKQEESYQRVYEAFTKLLSNVSNQSLGNARRLMSRLNQLVGTSSELPASGQESAAAAKQQVSAQNADEKTEQILTRLDQVNANTDQHTLRQLQEDVNRLVGTLSDAYLRNIRRVIERVNKTIGGSGSSVRIEPPSGVMHQANFNGQNNNQDGPPGFPGWDELITAVDRMQKSLASFVRSSTKLITAGRR